MAKLSGFRKLTKWLRENDEDFRKASTWTSAQSVEMSDGTTVEERLNNLKEIDYAKEAGEVAWDNVTDKPFISVKYEDGVLTFVL